MERHALDMIKLRQALEASWDDATSYMNVKEAGNPALGQCYPTSRVVQSFFPELEIVEGEVDAGNPRPDSHFWNVLVVGDKLYHIDLTWQQFPTGSKVLWFKIRGREALGDSQKTIDRCDLLQQRVEQYIRKEKSLTA